MDLTRWMIKVSSNRAKRYLRLIGQTARAYGSRPFRRPQSHLGHTPVLQAIRKGRRMPQPMPPMRRMADVHGASLLRASLLKEERTIPQEIRRTFHGIY
jgi:hypothetical protein